MGLFDFSKGKADEQGVDLVLAYLEAAHRTRSPFLLLEGSKGTIPAAIHDFHEDSKSFRLLAEGPLARQKGEKVDFLFFLDGLRLGATARILDCRTEVVGLQLPDCVELKERRRSARARMNPKERATVTALQALAEGIGIKGSPENLSEGGVRLQVDRAIAIATEARLVLGTTLVPPGQSFAFLRLGQVPRCPPLLELSGKAVYSEYAPSGLVIGFAFDPPPQEVKGPLGSFLASRVSPIPTTLPPKARRRQAQEDEEPVPEPEPPPKESPVTATPAAEEKEKTPKVVDTRAALLRLKKTSRFMVVYAPAGFQAGPLKTFLRESGFGRVAVVDRMEDLLETLRQPNLGALFIDWSGDPPEAIELLILLREAYEDLPPVVVAVRKVNEEVVLAAREVGVSHLMLRPYPLDAAFVSLLEGFFMHTRAGQG